MALDYIAQFIEGKSFFFEAICDTSGVQGLSLSFDVNGLFSHYYILNNREDEFKKFLNTIFSSSTWKTCWDSRDLVKLEIPFKGYCDIIDLSFFYKEDTLLKAASSTLTDSDIEEFQCVRSKVNSHIKACKITKIDLEKFSLTSIIPNDLMLSYYKLRNELLYELFKRLDLLETKDNADQNYLKIKTFYEIEKNGIHVNPNIEYDSSHLSDKRVISNINSQIHKNKIPVVYSKFNLKNATKTGRIHPVKNTFNCMNIPNTSIRRIIISRWLNGKIASIDLNAADYRCIINAVDDPFLNDLYNNVNDFHNKTAEFLFGHNRSNDVRRKVVKAITYSMIYGGSLNTISKQTGLSESKVQLAIEKLTPITSPINEFMNELYEKSMLAGFIEDPRGGKIKLIGNEHKGKVLALFAQRCCSLAFLDGVTALHNYLTTKRSLVLFTVHDEVVIDVNPLDINCLEEFKEILEVGTSSLFGIKIKAKVKSGLNYWDLK